MKEYTIYLASFNHSFMSKAQWRKFCDSMGYDSYMTDSILDKAMSVKIGETSNLRKRAANLYTSERIRMVQTFTFSGTKTEALFIESYIRMRTARYGAHVGLDHFNCKNVNLMKAINNRFQDWCKEAKEIIGK